MSGNTHPHQRLDQAPVTPGAPFNPLAVFDDDEPAPVVPVATTAAPAAEPSTAAVPVADTLPDPTAPCDSVVNPPEGTADTTPDDTTPADATDTAPKTGVDQEPVETDAERAARERHQTIATYAARRRRYTLLVLAVVALGVWHVKPWAGLAVPGLPGASLGVHTTAQAAKPAGDIIAQDMGQIHRRLARTGDLTGLRLPGADVAAAGTSLYAARMSANQCVVYGVTDGHDIVPTADATGQACTGQVKAVQAQLDAADATRRADAVTGSERLLTQAADTAAYYASANYVEGRQSLSGLPADQLGGADVVSNHGDWAQLRATYQGTCRTAIVAATGDLGEVSAC